MARLTKEFEEVKSLNEYYIENANKLEKENLDLKEKSKLK